MPPREPPLPVTTESREAEAGGRRWGVSEPRHSHHFSIESAAVGRALPDPMKRTAVSHLPQGAEPGS